MFFEMLRRSSSNKRSINVRLDYNMDAKSTVIKYVEKDYSDLKLLAMYAQLKEFTLTVRFL